MKKVNFIVPLLLILIVTGGCIQSSESISVSIEADREIYATMMSSVQGITFSAVLSNGIPEKEIVYQWIASDGIFIKTTSDHITNNGNSVLWNPINLDSTSATGTTIITLNVRDKQTNKILVKNSLKIEFDNQTYRVLK